MPDINISVQNKVASLTNAPVVVCGNSDYTVNFTFDTEFSEYEEHTMRVTFRDKGVEQHYDIQFSGNSVALPPMYRVEAISIGVYAGDIISSTAVIVPCYYGDVSTHADPPPDIYEQLLEYLAELKSGMITGQAVRSLYGSVIQPITGEKQLGLIASADIPAETDIKGKSVTDLQSGISVDNAAYTVSGTLKHITDWVSISTMTEEESGNFLALKFSVVGDPDARIGAMTEYGYSANIGNGIWVFRITDTSLNRLIIAVTKTGESTAYVYYTLTGLTLET